MPFKIRKKVNRALMVVTAVLVVSEFLLKPTFSPTPVAAAEAIQAGPVSLSLTSYASGFTRPISLTNSGIAGDGRLFVIEQAGRINIVQPGGAVNATPFLDIQARVDSSADEEGLLGFAFHPNYAGNGYFYVNYTYTSGTRYTRISRFSVTANADVADPNSEEVLMTVVQPVWNHNAGDIHFGPDGYLYIPLGDGGGSGDTSNNAQNLGLLLGKISRIDVDGGGVVAPDCVGLGTGNYTIPADNPFVGNISGTCEEIWAVGLRNPWRSSFDRETGDFWIGDVGQNAWEEVDFIPASSSGGENYGWRCYEGDHTFNTSGCGAIGDYVFPVHEYSQSLTNGCSVIGGYVYRGGMYPPMVGNYFFTDYCHGDFWTLHSDGIGGWIATEQLSNQGFGFVTFGEDVNGELYAAEIATGTVYRLSEDTVIFADGFETGDATVWSALLSP